jgi:hypothetical protein
MIDSLKVSMSRLLREEPAGAAITEQGFLLRFWSPREAPVDEAPKAHRARTLPVILGRMRKQLNVMPSNKPSACQNAATAKKTERPPLSSWDVFKIAKPSVWIGAVEALDKQAAVEKAAQEFKTEAWRLYAVKRR